MFAYVSPKFLTTFDDKQTPLSLVIFDPQLIFASRMNLGKVNQYLSYHIQEIIDLVLNDQRNSGVLINLLSCQIEPIFQSLLTNSNFVDKATEILSDLSNPSDIVISRLSSILLSALLTLPEQSSQQFGFIYHLLKRCDNSCAFNLFSTLLSNDERCLPAQKWLHDFGYSEFLMREIDSIDFEYKSPEGANPYYDRTYNVAACLYQLLAQAIHSKTFHDDFLHTKVIVIMKKSFKHSYPAFVKNARWHAISSLACEQNAEEMSSLLPEAISIFIEDLNHVYEYRVFIIQFITEIVKYQPFFATYLVDEKVPNWILHFLLRFPNVTIFHSAIREFADNALKIDILAHIIVSTYTPVLIEEAMVQTNKVFLPTVIALIESIRKAGIENRTIEKELDKIPQFAQFCQNQLLDYTAKAETSYGFNEYSSLSNLIHHFI